MEDFTKFKNGIVLYAIPVMVILEIVTLPFFGFNLKYTYGLLLGTAVSIGNFYLMAYTSKLVLLKGSGVWATIGYFIRLIIYGFVFFIAMKTSNYTGLGAGLGFITVKLAIYWRHGFKPKVNWKYNPKKNESGGKNTQEETILIRDPSMIIYVDGKKIVTHKKFIQKG